jgi:hypothetical protein
MCNVFPVSYELDILFQKTTAFFIVIAVKTSDHICFTSGLKEIPLANIRMLNHGIIHNREGVAALRFEYTESQWSWSHLH